jgi:ATP-dependent DNA helicase RecG
MDIAHLLKQPEGKTLEFKENLSSPRGVLRAIVAFANTAGGTVIIGVEDKSKHVCGVEGPHALEEKLANLIDDNIAPQILPEIEVVPWRNLYLLVVQVFPSSVRPHYVKQDGPEKGVYIRVGSTNRLADSIMQTELRRVKIEDSFDKQPISTLSLEAIDFRVASELFTPVRKLAQVDLESLDLVTTYQEKKVPTVGGLILFGTDRLKYFPDAWIQVGRFSGVTKTKIFDTQEITSYPILAIDEVMNFIKKHAMHGIAIPGAGYGGGSGSGAGFGDGAGYGGRSLSRHAETWSLPLTAVREAIINAVVHADYAQQGAPIRLSIFDDRIEIENPGLLLFGLTVDEIKRGVSKLRNRVIGQVFYRLGLIERWGSGIRRIIDSCREAGFAEPLFEEIGTHFRVTLFTQSISDPFLDEIEYAIIRVLTDKNGASTKEISEKIGRSVRATRTRLNVLIEKGLVIAVGSGVNDPQRKYFLS